MTATELEKYTKWYDKMVGIIGEKYRCKVVYPRDVFDYDNMLDGLYINFENGIHVKLSNLSMSQIYLTETRNRQYNMINSTLRFIDQLILDLFKK